MIQETVLPEKNLPRFTRVKVYIDGFNLYFGMASKFGNKYKWLNLEALALHLLRPEQELAGIAYFTSKLVSDTSKQQRQNRYIQALETTSVVITYGSFQRSQVVCNSCSAARPSYQEKMTDVNIAVRMLEDALTDQFDTAILISGDSDLKPPIESVRRLTPNKRIIVGFPPGRVSSELEKIAHGYFRVSEQALRHAQFPDSVHKADGVHYVTKPLEWR